LSSHNEDKDGDQNFYSSCDQIIDNVGTQNFDIELKYVKWDFLEGILHYRNGFPWSSKKYER